MTGIFSVLWRIEPVTSPRPVRHCSTCGGNRPFRSSGKIRLNANGRRLDAWLVYKCGTCDATWNLPLLERAAVGSVAEADLRALHHSDPAWVWLREVNLSLLQQYCDRIDLPQDVLVSKPTRQSLPDDWTEVELVLQASWTTGQRLDRLLAGSFGLARSEVAGMQRAGGLKVASGADKALRKLVAGRIAVRFVAGCLTECQRRGVAQGLFA